MNLSLHLCVRVAAFNTLIPLADGCAFLAQLTDPLTETCRSRSRRQTS